MSSTWGQPCLAITAKGKPCGHGHVVEHPCTFTWDPVKGIGESGPDITLCRMHYYMWELEEHERVEIRGGWMGRAYNPDAGVYTVLTTVYEHKTGFYVSPQWYAMRRPSRFGQLEVRRTFHDAITSAS